MTLLPYEKIIYLSKLSKTEITDKLAQQLEPKKAIRIKNIFSINSNSKPYAGTIKGDTFQINKIISYRNSFLPQIYGAIESTSSGAKVKVKMQLHPLIIVFSIIWCSVIAMFCAALLFSMFKEEAPKLEILFPLGMLLFMYLMVMGGFKYESAKSKAFLSKLFEAEPE